jgi:heme oxygenase
LTGALRAALREATAESHQRLESALDLLAQPLQPRRIGAVLQRFHGFHHAWEPALADALDDPRFQSRLPQLRHDLRLFGLSDDQIDALPACAEAATLCATAASAWGSLYVMEGSTLGGRFIRRALQQAPAYPAGAWQYFDPHGEHTGARWNDTLARLAALPPALAPAVIDGAQRCFALLQRWLVTGEVSAKACA